MQPLKTSSSSQQKGDSEPRQQSFDHMDYKEANSSTDILVAIFKDMYENGRPSPTLSPLMSSYASMRLGVYADSTNSVPVVQTSDDYYGSTHDNGYFLRGANNASNFESDKYQRLSRSNTWVTALTWGPREAGMLALTPRSQGYIEDTETTVEYLTALAHEWQQYSFDTSLAPGALDYESRYIRSGSDAIFRITSHTSQRFISKSSKTTALDNIMGDNHLHVASIWDVAVGKWLLLGIFLCPQGLAFDHSWSKDPKLADTTYTNLLAKKIPSDKVINVNPLPDIIVTAASSRSSTASLEKAIAETEKSNQNPAATIEEGEGDDEDDDDSDYWNQYDDNLGSEDEGDDTEKEEEAEGVSDAVRQMKGFSVQNDNSDDESYYNSYADVEHMIHGDDVDRSEAPQVDMVESLTDSEPGHTMKRAGTPVWPGAFPKARHTSPKVESSVDTKSPELEKESPKAPLVSSVKTHVSESIASLYKLAHSQGISMHEFMDLTLDAVKSVDV